MASPVILTAGKATRAGQYAPNGCKALVSLDGKPVIEWQLDVLGSLDGEPIIVCRSEHEPLLRRYGRTVINDRGRGAGDALASALAVAAEPIVVAYADTFFTELPDGTDWCGVALAHGGRSWYVVSPQHTVAYLNVPADEVALVGVGLFAFSDIDRLQAITGRFGTEWRWRGQEWGLDVVLNAYETWRAVAVPSWQDVGSSEAIEAWSAA